MVPANDEAPNEPAVNTLKASEQKLIRINLCNIWSSLFLSKALLPLGFCQTKFVATSNAGFCAENPHRDCVSLFV